MSSEEDRRATGVRMFASQFGLPADEVPEFMDNMLGAHMAREAQLANAAAWTDERLTPRDRSLVVIAALVAQGGVGSRLRGHLRWARTNGATRDELEALMALMAVYCGYPKASVGMELLLDELGEDEA